MDEHHNIPRRLLGIGSGEELATNQKALYAVLCALFVCGSGLASGLTLGLMSLDPLDMQVLLRSGTPKQQKHAKAILPVIKDAHWLLVTLLLCNAACFEALPLFLDTLINPVGAILISVTLILLFGEILPQAVCARHGLAIGAALGWPVRFFMWLTAPISWPLARFLDWLLGKEGYDTFMRHELKALVDLHGADEGLGGKLSDNEVQIICGALDLTNKIAYSAMTPLDKVAMLSTDQRLDRPTINMILASGHSRLPVYAGNSKTNIIGLILVKELLAHAFPTAEEVESQGPVEVSTLKIRPLPRLSGSTRCYDMLKLFQTGRAHMVLLTQPDLEQEKEEEKRTSAAKGVTLTLAAETDPVDRASPNTDVENGNSASQPGTASKRVKDSKEGESILTRTSHRLMDKILKRESTASASHSSSEEEHGAPPEVIVPDLAKPGEPIGIITIEDVLEELMGQEILDETDQFADNEGTMPVNDETRTKLAEKLPERVRAVILGSGILGMARRLSRTSGGAKAKPEGASGAAGGNYYNSRTSSGNVMAAANKAKAGTSHMGPDAV